MSCLNLAAQQVPPKQNEMPPYFRKEEIIYDNKRYRIHNNYLTLGAGYLGSSIRNQGQNTIGIDFQFHIRTYHFQIGGMTSGDAFSSNNNLLGHFTYGYRKETTRFNYAGFIGPSYFSGVEGDTITGAHFYKGIGLYGSLQVVTKFAYDIGLGLELFGELDYKQRLFGFRIIAFFSGSFRGSKRIVNPNVRPEPRQ